MVGYLCVQSLPEWAWMWVYWKGREPSWKRGWINFEFEFEFEFELTRVRVDSSSSCLRGFRCALQRIYLVRFMSHLFGPARGLTFEAGQRRVCRCAHSPLLTEIRWGLVLRGVARAVYMYMYIHVWENYWVQFVTTPQHLLQWQPFSQHAIFTAPL